LKRLRMLIFALFIIGVAALDGVMCYVCGHNSGVRH
jgi:hypothetical protein